ncbi:hypothetical protein [Anaerofustis butyriciformans]|uniref:hypothetical protein n=1 Tax=Anaerofustis butyriciformans TaxID=3108533 RepID=UPI003F8925D4
MDNKKNEIIDAIVTEKNEKVIPETVKNALINTKPLINNISNIQEQLDKVSSFYSTTPFVNINNFNYSFLVNFKTNIPNYISLLKNIQQTDVMYYNLLFKYHSVFDDLTDFITKKYINLFKSINVRTIASIESPFLKWINTIEITYINSLLQQFECDKEKLYKLKALKNKFIEIMYECHWFPYVANGLDLKLINDIITVVNNSRNFSKRCINRVDKIILSYYSKTKILAIKKNVKNFEISPHIYKIFNNAINAYFRKEYALVIPCLVTMWEYLIKLKANEPIKVNKVDPKSIFKGLIYKNGYNNILDDFYKNMILGQCYSSEDMVEGIPNRHGISHGVYLDGGYPSRKAALNAILFTEFIIKLQ